jgi:hypothetical protein
MAEALPTHSVAYTIGKAEPFISLLENRRQIRNFCRPVVGPTEVKIISVGLLEDDETWGLYPHIVARPRLHPHFAQI